MQRLKKGDVVSWKSQAGGVLKKKEGVIVQVVAAGEPAEVSYDACEKGFSVEFNLPAKPRPEESYLVLVENVRKGRPGIYWPPANKLDLVVVEKTKPAAEEKTQKSAGLLPGMPARGAIGIACDEWLTQSQVCKEQKRILLEKGRAIVSSMVREGKQKLCLTDAEGVAWCFEAMPSGFHLRVKKAKA